jgi:ATP-dependent DNA ligase
LVVLQDEGIVCKQLESPWKPDDRSGAWVKMKPEYIGQQELDCVIIAVYLGNGSRGGQVTSGFSLE